jgi:biopolymer transport protein ExbD
MSEATSRLSAAAGIEAEKQKRAYRRARRKMREAEGEIRELNIVAMMDMMTILLVFLLKSYQASTVNVQMGENFAMPVSTTQLHPQENITVQVSMSELVVNERKVLDLENGVIPAASKEGGKAEAFFVEPVYDALKREVDRQKEIAKYNKALAVSGRINVVADKKISYRTLMDVLYTAGQAELGEYKFMVLKAGQ